MRPEKTGLDILMVGAASAMGGDYSSHAAYWASRRRRQGEDLVAFPNILDGSVSVRRASPSSLLPDLKTPKTAKFLTREMCLILSASAEVRSRFPAVPADRKGIVVATAPALASVAEIAGIQDRCVVDGVLQPALLARDLPVLIPATWPSRCLKATTACHLAAELNWLGPNLTLSPRRLAGLGVVPLAALLLESNAADVVLAGGADSRTDEVSIAEAVGRRRARLGTDRLNSSQFPEGFSEGAAVLLIARVGEFSDPIARIIGWEEVHSDGPADALARAFRDVLVRFKGPDGRPPRIWVDLDPDFVTPDFRWEEFIEPAGDVGDVVDARGEYGNVGIATPGLALVAAVTASVDDPTRRNLVVSVGEHELLAIAMGGPDAVPVP